MPIGSIHHLTRSSKTRQLNTKGLLARKAQTQHRHNTREVCVLRLRRCMYAADTLQWRRETAMRRHTGNTTELHLANESMERHHTRPEVPHLNRTARLLARVSLEGLRDESDWVHLIQREVKNPRPHANRQTTINFRPAVCWPSHLWWGAICIRLVTFESRDTTGNGWPHISHFAMVFIVPQT